MTAQSPRADFVGRSCEHSLRYQDKEQPPDENCWDRGRSRPLRDRKLMSLIHEGEGETSRYEAFIESLTSVSGLLVPARMYADSTGAAP